jgi:hypothetical protein
MTFPRAESKPRAIFFVFYEKAIDYGKWAWHI